MANENQAADVEKASEPSKDDLEAIANEGPSDLRSALEENYKTAAETGETEEADQIAAEDAVAADEVAAEKPEEASGEATAEKGDEAADEAPTASEDTGEQEDADKPAAVEAPASWNKDDREIFAKLPDDAQGVIQRRENERDAAANRLIDFKRTTDNWGEYLGAIGQDASQAFHTLLTYESALRTGTPQQKVAVISQLVQTYGVQFSQPTQQAQPADDTGEQPQVAPEVMAAVEPLAQRLGQVEAAVTSRAANDEAQAFQDASTAILAFRDAKNEDGSLKHPHFDEVHIQMEQLLLLEKAQKRAVGPADLKRLYEAAVWQNPKTRDELIAAQQSAAVEDFEAKRKQHLKKAKKAGVSVTGSSAGGPKPAASANLRDTIQQAYREQS